MSELNLEKILLDNPKFVNLSFSNYQELISKKYINTFNPKLTWGEMGFDDLDLVEMIMEIEKQFDFNFPDILFDEIFGTDKYPVDFRTIDRNNKIDKLIK
jgi:acyl carrier protein